MIKEKCVANSSNFKLTIYILVTGGNKNVKPSPTPNLLKTVNQNQKYGRTIKKKANIFVCFCLLFKYDFKCNGFYYWIPRACSQSSLRLNNESIRSSPSQNELSHFFLIFMLICHTLFSLLILCVSLIHSIPPPPTCILS